MLNYSWQSRLPEASLSISASQQLSLLLNAASRGRRIYICITFVWSDVTEDTSHHFTLMPNKSCYCSLSSVRSTTSHGC